MPAGLPHYRNSKTSMESWEPLYLNLFQVVFSPPTLVGDWTNQVENITKVSGLSVDQQPNSVVEQRFKGAKRSFTGALPDTTTVDISMDFNVNLNSTNSMFVYKALRRWTDLVWDPLTGAAHLKKDYIGGPLVISIYNKIGQVTRQYTFPQVFPTKPLPPMDLTYENGNNIYAVTGFTFRADYWDDVSI